ncbi:MAG TPA: hypothetical protein VEJ46_12150 [Candidatus Acidoferrum sp.]|nr:hypothetical protein [Candidatus Acidoferrum sp.]
MRRLVPFVLFACAFPAFGQTQLVCRDLKESGGYLYQGETVVNGMACRQVTYAPAQQQAVAAPVADPKPAQTASSSTPSSDPGANPASASFSATTAQPRPSETNGGGSVPITASQPQPGARVAIAPMGGFETYFAAAVREKKVPVAITLNRDTAQYFIVSSETEWHGFVYGSGGSASWNQNGGSAVHGSAASSTRGVEASIMLIDANTKDVVWAYEVHKNSHGSLLLGTFGARGQQSVAEACAKHLKEFIEKGK